MQIAIILVLLVSSILISPTANTQSLAGYTFNPSEKTTPFALKLNPFSTDGCSKYPDGTKENPTLWRDCCVNHDLKYWLGGTSDERKLADEELYTCVKSKGEPTRARIMYMGVRAGGGPLNQTTYRWGYGWNRVRDYKKLTSQEIQMAYEMYGDNLEKLKSDITQNKYIVQNPETYEFISPFPYTYCEEEIINYLSPKLSRNATVTESNDYMTGSDYNIKIHLDICDDVIEFEFNSKTTSRTCQKDYAYSRKFNKIKNVRISKECLKSF